MSSAPPMSRLSELPAGSLATVKAVHAAENLTHRLSALGCFQKAIDAGAKDSMDYYEAAMTRVGVGMVAIFAKVFGVRSG